MLIKLTPSQREIVEHRLGNPDTISDALSEMFPDTDLVEITAAAMSEELKSGSLNLDSDLKLEVFIDCLDGSTFFANSEDAVVSKEISRGQLLAWQKAAKELEQISVDLGNEVSIPRFDSSLTCSLDYAALGRGGGQRTFLAVGE